MYQGSCLCRKAQTFASSKANREKITDDLPQYDNYGNC